MQTLIYTTKVTQLFYVTSEPKEFERLVFRLRLAVEKEPDDALPRKVVR